jgi:hypothetical protein
VVSPEIHVPSDLDRDGIERYRQSVEQLLNRLTLEAEAWAESGIRKIEEVPLRREPIWRGYPRLDLPCPPDTTADLATDERRSSQMRKAG